MFTAFFDLVNPDSTNVKPACIKNTSIPDNKIQSIVKSSLTSAILVVFKSKKFNIIIIF